MAEMQTGTAQPEALDNVPVLRSDVDRVVLGTESVAWSPVCSVPVYLDPVANLLYDIIDGDASVADLIEDVVAAVGIERRIAANQLHRVVTLLADGGLLADDDAIPAPLPTHLLSDAHDN